MERKHFLSAGLIGASAIVVAAGAGMADTSGQTGTNQPSPYNPCQPSGGRPYGESPHAQGSPNPAAVLEHADRNLGRLITMLQRDPNDYAGHKAQAIGFLQQALSQVQAALQTSSGNEQSLIQSSL